MEKEMEKKGIVVKACLFGEYAVGKTSLIRRFVLDQYDDKYLATIGTKITKKVISVPVPKEKQKVRLILMLWDIMGQKGFRRLLEEAYFSSADGLIGVCDITRKSTLDELLIWRQSFHRVTGDVPTIIFANKWDLKKKAEVTEKEIQVVADEFNATCLFTSAKTGMNVEKGFNALSSILVRERI